MGILADNHKAALKNAIENFLESEAVMMVNVYSKEEPGSAYGASEFPELEDLLDVGEQDMSFVALYNDDVLGWLSFCLSEDRGVAVMWYEGVADSDFGVFVN